MTRHVFTDSAITRMRQMMLAGSTAAEIAMSIGSTEGAVHSKCHQLGINRRLHGFMSTGVPRTVVAAFNAEAKRRGTKLEKLLHDLLIKIAADNLFNAIIDD
jgi:alcohol dehydrogenase class IV